MEKIIVCFKNDDIELNMSLYKFIKENHDFNQPFVVCHVTEEEYNTMISQMRNGKKVERTTCLVHNNGYDRNRYMLWHDMEKNIIRIINYDNNWKHNGPYYIEDGNRLVYEKNTDIPYENMGTYSMYYSEYKIYTTESYEDVIEHMRSISLEDKYLDIEREKTKPITIKDALENLYKIRKNTENNDRILALDYAIDLIKRLDISQENKDKSKQANEFIKK